MSAVRPTGDFGYVLYISLNFRPAAASASRRRTEGVGRPLVPLLSAPCIRHRVSGVGFGTETLAFNQSTNDSELGNFPANTLFSFLIWRLPRSIAVLGRVCWYRERLHSFTSFEKVLARALRRFLHVIHASHSGVLAIFADCMKFQNLQATSSLLPSVCADILIWILSCSLCSNSDSACYERFFCADLLLARGISRPQVGMELGMLDRECCLCSHVFPFAARSGKQRRTVQWRCRLVAGYREHDPRVSF